MSLINSHAEVNRLGTTGSGQIAQRHGDLRSRRRDKFAGIGIGRIGERPSVQCHRARHVSRIRRNQVAESGVGRGRAAGRRQHDLVIDLRTGHGLGSAEGIGDGRGFDDRELNVTDDVLSGVGIRGTAGSDHGIDAAVVMVGSRNVNAPGAGAASYSCAKAALTQLCRIAALELAPHGVRVNIVAPGLVETEMGRRLVKATAGVDDLRVLDASSPFGRVCQPEDISNVVRYLVFKCKGQGSD